MSIAVRAAIVSITSMRTLILLFKASYNNRTKSRRKLPSAAPPTSTRRQTLVRNFDVDAIFRIASTGIRKNGHTFSHRVPRTVQSTLTRLITGHAFTGAYRIKFQRKSLPPATEDEVACACGAVPEDTEHVLLHCPLTHNQRLRHLSTDRLPDSLRKLFDSPKRCLGLLRFLEETCLCEVTERLGTGIIGQLEDLDWSKAPEPGSVDIGLTRASHDPNEIGAARMEVLSKNKREKRGPAAIVWTAVPLDDYQDGESTLTEGGIDWWIVVLDAQEDCLIYMWAASSASASLYSNGDLGGAGDGD
ncbi:hypothetical protein V8E52_011010 [Russula decolorans]